MSDEKLIYFVRHGETGWNKDLRVQGRNDIELNSRGIDQAERVSARLKKSAARLVCSSPLLRAAQTAKIIAGNTRQLILWQELQEQDYGAWEGMTMPDVVEKFSTDFARWKHLVPAAEITSGETEEQSFRRAQIVIKKLQQLPNKEIIVVTHGGILKIILIALLGSSTKTLLWNYFVGNCSLSAVKIDEEGKAKLLFLNDGMHIALKADSKTELIQKISHLPLLP